MPYDESLAARVRPLLARKRGFDEKKMFGGVGFLLHGNMCVGVWKDGGVEIIANAEGSRTTPSWVAFTEEERLIGQAAVSQGSTNPANTVYDVKRIIGQRFDEGRVSEDIRRFPFDVTLSAVLNDWRRRVRLAGAR